MHFPSSKIPNSWRIFDWSRILVCWCPGLTDELGLNFTPQDESICDDGRGSEAPSAQGLPCCHAPNIQCAIMPSGQTRGRGQMLSNFKGNSTEKLDRAIPAWLWFCALSYWMTLFCDRVMQCHVMSVTLSSVSRWSVAIQALQGAIWGGRIHSNAARYLDISLD